MVLKAYPFESKHLEGEGFWTDEDKDSRPLVIRINAKERVLIEELKAVLNYGQDAKVIKAGLVVLKNVILGTFGADLMAKISDKERRRPIIEADKNKQDS